MNSRALFILESKITKTEKEILHGVTYMWNLKNKLTYRVKKLLSGVGGCWGTVGEARKEYKLLIIR